MVPGTLACRVHPGAPVTCLRACGRWQFAHPEGYGLHPQRRWFVAPSSGRTHWGEESIMLWTILVILVVLWALGLLASVGGAAIHLLLVLALVVLVVQLLSGRRSVY